MQTGCADASRVSFLRAPGGDRTWIAVLLLVCGVLLVCAGALNRFMPLGAAGALVTVMGAGLWFERRWARWLGSALFAASALWFAWNLALIGLDLYRILGLCACAFFSLEIWLRFKPAR
jgi:uncharacterized membrane protein